MFSNESSGYATVSFGMMAIRHGLDVSSVVSAAAAPLAAATEWRNAAHLLPQTTKCEGKRKKDACGASCRTTVEEE
jgi:hypothetical protein